MFLIFVGTAHRRKFFNSKNFLNYGSLPSTCTVGALFLVSTFGSYSGLPMMMTKMDVVFSP